MPNKCDPNVDRSIVMTQYDLRGFQHAMGFRMKEKNAKNLDAITCNLMGFAHERIGDAPAPGYVSYRDSTYEDYLEMCKRIKSKCDGSQCEAIQLIIKDIISYNHALTQDEEQRKSLYLGTLTKDNRWGKAVLCLMEAFDVKVEESTT